VLVELGQKQCRIGRCPAEIRQSFNDGAGEDDHCDSLHEMQESHDDIEATQTVHFSRSPHEGEVVVHFRFFLLMNI